MIEEGEHLVIDNPEETLFSWEFFGILDFSKWPDAENQLLKLTEKYPEMGQTHLFLAKYYLEKNRLDLTFKSIANSLKDPLIEESMVKYMTMNAFSVIKQKQDVEGASGLIDQVLKVFPLNAKFLSLKGNLHANLGELSEAQIFYTKSIRVDPSKFDVWQGLIEIDFELNKVDSVIVHSEEALTVFPNQGFLYFQLGFAQFLKSKNFQALASLETATSYVSPKDSWYPQLYSILGDNYQSMGRHKESDESFEKVLAVDPDDEHVLNNYSYYLSIRKVNLEKAAQMSKMLVEKFPNNGTYLDTYAWVMFQKAEYKMAVNYLERAVLGDKMESSIVWEHYGDALVMANRIEDALKAWKKAKSLPGSSIILDKKIQMKQYSEN
jgi:tetratricopeptide (TPR) repeat protein